MGVLRAVNVILIVISFGILAAAGPVQPPVKAAPPATISTVTLQEANWIKLQELRSKQLKTYQTTTGSVQLLESDVATYLTEVEKLKVFPDVPGFRTWMKQNQSKVLSPEMTELMKDQSVSEFATAMYFNYTAEVAANLDKNLTLVKQGSGKSSAQKGSVQPEAPTPGEKYYRKTQESIWGHPAVTVVATTVGVASGIVVAKAGQLLFFGPLVRITNTMTGPIIDPVIERADKEINSTYGVHRWILRWKAFTTGDSARAKEARRQAATGKDLIGDARRFFHPAISVEDFTAAHLEFYTESLKADSLWKGWENANNVRARNTGFELLFHQYTSFGERQNTYTVAISVAESDLERHVAKLLKAGLTETEVEYFQKLVAEYQELMIFENPHHGALATLGRKIEDVVMNWRGRGVSEQLINKAYGSQRAAITSSNRKAFSLASFLYAELFYRENNLALKDLPKLQALQETNRELSGLYQGLEEDRVRIEKIFGRMNLKYDVQARIDERGFPLGGPARPKGVAPIADPVYQAQQRCQLDFAKLAPEVLADLGRAAK